jgi:hypothetical protein
MRVVLLSILAVLGACGGEDLPTAAELHGTWTSDFDGQHREFVFAAEDDGTYPELAGLTDVYVLSSYPIDTTPTVVQTGEYRVERVTLTEGGEDDALVTVVHAGNGAGNTLGNAIYGWTGTSFTISGTSSSTGELTFTRAD